MQVKALRKLLWVANTLLVLGIVAYALFFFILSSVRRDGWRSAEQFLTKRNLPEAAPDVKTDKVLPFDTYLVCPQLVIDGDLPPPPAPKDPGGVEVKVSPLAQDYELHWVLCHGSDVTSSFAHLFHKADKKYVHVMVGEYVEFVRTGKHVPGDWKLVSVSATTPWIAEFVADSDDDEEKRVKLDQVRDPHSNLGSGPPPGIKEIGDGSGEQVSLVKEQPRERPTRELVEVRPNEFDVPPEETEWWGLHGEAELTEKVALKELKVDGKAAGLMFKSIEKKSMMERRGMKSGDILKSINGKPVSSRQGLVNYVKGEGKGLTRYTVEIERNGKIITKTYNVKKK